MARVADTVIEAYFWLDKYLPSHYKREQKTMAQETAEKISTGTRTL